jgi:lactococcin 972 family bacteriocin
MNKRKILMLGAVVGALLCTPAVAASATTASVGGGFWSYGVTSSTVYSNYHHPSRYHTATACNGSLGSPCLQVAAAAGAWANSSLPKSIVSNSAYWATY